MDLTNEINFGALQKEERYKKLQRNLKLAYIKQLEIIKQSEFNRRTKSKINYTPKLSGVKSLSSWPSLSSINAECGPSDLNYTSVSLQSKTGSEILASSLHFNNLHSKKIIFPRPMAASSIKQNSEAEQTIDDRLIMPPPPDFNKRPALKKLPPPNTIISTISTQCSASLNNITSRNKQFYSDTNSSAEYTEDSGFPHDLSRGKASFHNFYRWRVTLNDKDHLLIKGALDSPNGRNTRSKPVSKIITATKVESIYKHIYCLHGKIFDERNELPKYVYTKFYNGFPDDWENVYQIWRDYVAQGSKETYRWPTDVSFSDDDLNSEITDVLHLDKDEKQLQKSSILEKSIPQRSSGYSSDIYHDRNSKSRLDNNSLNPFNLSKRNKVADSFNTPDQKQNKSHTEISNPMDNSNDRSRGNLYTALNFAQKLKDFIFEDKLTIITQNLLKENCSNEYVEIVNEIIEKLNYAVSHNINKSDATEMKQSRLESKNDSCISQALQRHCSTPLGSNERNFNPLKENNHEIMEKSSRYESESAIMNNKESKELSVQAVNKKVTNTQNDCDDSESETYFGIPKISADRIFQIKSHSRFLSFKKMEKKSRNIRTERNFRNFQYNLDDSCVSVTEDELPQNNQRARTNDSEASRYSRPPLENLDRRRMENPAVSFNSNRSNFGVNNNNIICKTRKSPQLALNEYENIQSLSDKENIDDKQRNVQDFERRELYNLQNDVSDGRVREKPIVTSIETVDVLKVSKRPPKNQFLSFDSEDEEEEERAREERSNTLKNVNSTENLRENNDSNHQNNEINDSFGSEKNPKLLESWTPSVTFDGKAYYLAFEGILLNAVGRPMKRKFITNHVIRRISSNVIQTSDQQFYKLLGEMCNNKHVVPKELLLQCRNGCPAKIDNFCANWIKLKGENNMNVECAQNTNSELPTSVPSSSRGRRLLPPLNYWSDERVVIKDDTPIYKPGEPKENFVSSSVSSPQGAQERHLSNEPVKIISNKEDLRNSRVSQKLSYSFSDNEEAKGKKQHLKRKSGRSNDFKETSTWNEDRLRKFQEVENTNRYKFRKRQRIDLGEPETNSDSEIEKGELPVKSRIPVVRCHYKQNQPLRHTSCDFSENEFSTASVNI